VEWLLISTALFALLLCSFSLTGATPTCHLWTHGRKKETRENMMETCQLWRIHPVSYGGTLLP
jgi:hypothetical protein